MGRKKILIPLLIVVGLISASMIVGVLQNVLVETTWPSSGSFLVGSDRKSVASMPETGASQVNRPFDQIGRQTVLTGSLELEVKEGEKALFQIRTLAEQSGGFVSDLSSSTTEGKTVATITIRVPRQEFFDILDGIEKIGSVQNKQVTTQDVTDSYVDLKAKLENYKREEARMQELLGMAKNLDEVLRVESELSRIREEIDRTTGMLQLLENQIELSTISIYLYEKAEPSPAKLPELDLLAALSTGLRGLYAIVYAILVITIAALPIMGIGFPAYYFIRRSRKS